MLLATRQLSTNSTFKLGRLCRSHISQGRRRDPIIAPFIDLPQVSAQGEVCDPVCQRNLSHGESCD